MPAPPPDAVAAVQKTLGRERAGALVEEALAEIAEGLVEVGRAPPGGGRRRDLRRRRAARSASRRCASARRSIPACRRCSLMESRRWRWR